MVIFKPDGSHGMYSWIHVLLATACAVAAWYSLYKSRPRGQADDATAGSRVSVRHRLGATHHLAGLMRVQRVDRPGVVLPFRLIRRA